MTDQELAKKILPLVQAVAEGKRLQVFSQSSCTWDDTCAYVCDVAGNIFRSDLHYRVKPEPREWWAVVLNANGVIQAGFMKKDDAQSYTDRRYRPEEYAVVPVKEVL